MAYAMSCYLHSERNVPLQMIQPQEETNQNIRRAESSFMLIQQQRSPPTASRSFPLPSATATKETSTNNETESEDPFQDAEIPNFDLGQIMDTIEKENTVALVQKTSEDETTTTTNIIQ